MSRSRYSKLDLFGKESPEETFFRNLDFILSHFQKPIFPRFISTRSKQLEVSSEEEMLKAYEESNFIDCKFNAYPPYTEFKGIQRYPPDFILADLNISSFKNKQALERALKSTLNRIKLTINGSPTVLWIGNGYHIYQPVEAVLFEQFIDFEGFDRPSGRFLKFAEQYLTNEKSDPSRNLSFKECMIRFPGSINSVGPEGNEEVRVIQKWDGHRPPITPLRRAFLDYLVSEKIKEAKHKGSR